MIYYIINVCTEVTMVPSVEAGGTYECAALGINEDTDSGDILGTVRLAIFIMQIMLLPMTWIYVNQPI